MEAMNIMMDLGMGIMATTMVDTIGDTMKDMKVETLTMEIGDC